MRWADAELQAVAPVPGDGPALSESATKTVGRAHEPATGGGFRSD